MTSFCRARGADFSGWPKAGPINIDCLGPLYNFQTDIFVSCHGALDIFLLCLQATRVDVYTLEMVVDPTVIDIFNAVDDGSAHQGAGVLVRERVRSDQTCG